MVGLRPIIEFMTWNFSLTAYDQLVNNAAKLRYMSNGQFTLPIVFRGPGGAAHALGAQHSQALESLYAHIPGLKVVMPSTPGDGKGLLKSSIRDDNPVCFIESEVMYALKGEVPGGEYLIPLGVADIKRPGRDVTIVTAMKGVHDGLDAADALERDGISAEVIDLRTLRPLDAETVVASVRKTNRIVAVEEGPQTGGWAGEVLASATEQALGHLDDAWRIATPDTPIPYSPPLEDAFLPGPERIASEIRQRLRRA